MRSTLAGGGIDRTCSVLCDEHRRLVLRHLESEPSEVTRDALARELAGTTGQPESTERILTVLHHVHLPKLSDENAIRYDADEGVVSATPQTERYIEWLDAMENRPR